jgi:hypothetical protein
MTPAPVRVGTIFIPIMALPVRRCDHIANIRRQAPGFVQSFAAFQKPAAHRSPRKYFTRATPLFLYLSG